MVSWISKTVYALQRQYGVPISIYQNSIQQTDILSGVATLEKTKYQVKKAVKLPKSHVRQILDETFLEHRNFKFGAYKLAEDQVFLLRDKDINFPLTLNDYIFCEGRRYNIKDIAKYDGGFIVTTKEIDDVRTFEILEHKLLNRFHLHQNVVCQHKALRHVVDSLEFVQEVENA
jgi:hypothetical protein